MSFLSRLAGKKKQIDDPEMGLLRQEGGDFWTGEIFFQPAKRKVSVTVWADNNGPGQGHRDFLKMVSQKYPSLKGGITIAVQRALNNTFKDDSVLPPDELWEKIEIDGIEIPDLYPHPGDWGLYFHGAPLRGHAIKVSMKDWEVVGAEIL